MKTLDSLKSLGYDVKVNEGGNIKLSYIGEGMPDKNRVLPLLHELKTNKGEAIKILREELQPISSDILDDLLFGVIRKTKGYSKKIVRDYIENNHKDIADRITETRAEVSNVFALCKEGKASVHDFKAVLEPYHDACAKGIEVYKRIKGVI